MSHNKMSKREVKRIICELSLKNIYAQLVKKYGFEFKVNRPLSYDSFKRFAQSDEATGTIENMVDKYLTTPKGELRFDKLEQQRTEKLAKKLDEERQILKEFGFDDSDDVRPDSFEVNEVTPDEFEFGVEVNDIEGIDKYGLAEFQGEMYILCEGLSWNRAYFADDCWVRAISAKADLDADHVYACVLLHFNGYVGNDEVYHAIGREDSDDRFCFRNGGEFFKLGDVL